MVPGAEREQRHQEKEEKEKEEEKEAHGWSTLIQGTTMFFFHDRGLVPPPPPPPGTRFETTVEYGPTTPRDPVGT